MIRPLDALASAVDLALRNTNSRLYMLPVDAADAIRRPLEREREIYANALAVARGEIDGATLYLDEAVVRSIIVGSRAHAAGVPLSAKSPQGNATALAWRRGWIAADSLP